MNYRVFHVVTSSASRIARLSALTFAVSALGSRTIRGAVERMDRLNTNRPDLAEHGRAGGEMGRLGRLGRKVY